MANVIQSILGFIKSIFKFHKLKILLVFTSALLFTVLLFPYSDLADFTTAQVSKMTNNQVFLSFDEMGIGLLPTPSVDLEKVQVETAQVSNLKVGSLSIAPSIAALLSFKKGVALSAEDLLKGDLNLVYKEGDLVKGKKEIRSQNIEADFVKVDLAEIEKLYPLPVKLKGQASGDIEVSIDPSFSTQPDGTTEMKIKNFVMPPGSVNTQMGPIDTPEIKFSEVKLRGKISGSSFNIEEVLLGKTNDAINGKVRGKMTIKIKRFGAKVAPVFGAYNFDISLNITKAKASELFFLSFLDSFKQNTNKGSRFLFAVSGTRFGVTPNMKSTQPF